MKQYFFILCLFCIILLIPVAVSADDNTTVTIPSVGTITISSVPAGANIYIDNSYKGLTPLSLSDISNGNRTILLKSDGYQDWSKIVFVNGDSQTVSATLLSVTTTTTTAVTTATTTSPVVNGTLYVQSSPSGASVYVDSNTYLGKTTMTLYNITPGTHTIHLLLSGYNDWSDTITVMSGNTTNEYATLTATAAEVTAATTTLPTTVKTTLKVTTAKVPTSYPKTTTTTKASPVEGAVVLGAIGFGIVVLHRKY